MLSLCVHVIQHALPAVAGAFAVCCRLDVGTAPFMQRQRVKFLRQPAGTLLALLHPCVQQGRFGMRCAPDVLLSVVVAPQQQWQVW